MSPCFLLFSRYAHRCLSTQSLSSYSLWRSIPCNLRSFHIRFLSLCVPPHVVPSFSPPPRRTLPSPTSSLASSSGSLPSRRGSRTQEASSLRVGDDIRDDPQTGWARSRRSRIRLSSLPLSRSLGNFRFPGRQAQVEGRSKEKPDEKTSAFPLTSLHLQLLHELLHRLKLHDSQLFQRLQQSIRSFLFGGPKENQSINARERNDYDGDAPIPPALPVKPTSPWRTSSR